MTAGLRSSLAAAVAAVGVLSGCTTAPGGDTSVHLTRQNPSCLFVCSAQHQEAPAASPQVCAAAPAGGPPPPCESGVRP